MSQVPFARKLQSETVDFVLDELGQVGMIQYRATIAEAVSAFASGVYFTSDDQGSVTTHPNQLRTYKRTASSPFYQDMGDTAVPGGLGLLASTSPGSGVDLVARSANPVASVSAMRALNTTKFQTAILQASGREGVFNWKSGNFSAQVTADTQAGIYVASNANLTGSLGAWVREVDGAYNVKWWGALGDGATNDSTAIQAAINTVSAIGGGALFLPAGTYRATSQINLAAKVSITGAGNSCSILASAATAAGSVGLAGQSLSKISITDIAVTGPTANNSVSIRLTDCNDCTISGVHVSNHYSAGIEVTGTSARALITGNRFSSAFVVAAFGAPVASDIFLTRNVSGCVVTGNNCDSGGGYGIAVRTYQSATLSETVTDTLIADNRITGYNSYGIMVYRDGPYSGMQDTQVLRTTITGNIINNISGARPATAGGTDYTFGAGIYIQGAEHTVVSNNVINRSHSGAVTFVELLAPGAIGVSNCGMVTVSGNIMTECGYCGIYLNDTLALGIANGAMLIDNNSIKTTVRAGINVNSQKNVKITGGSIIGTTLQGVSVTKAGSSTNFPDNFTMSDVVIKNTGNSGVNVTSSTNVQVSNVSVDTCAADGFNFGTCNNVVVNACVGANLATRGINVAATVVKASVRNCLLSGASGATVGYSLFSQTAQSGNIATGFTNSTDGTYSERTAVTSGTTLEVGGRQNITMTYAAATNVTGLTETVLGASYGAVVTLYFTNANVTLVHSSALAMKGATNFTPAAGNSVTFMSVASGAGASWREIGRNA